MIMKQNNIVELVYYLQEVGIYPAMFPAISS